jgi:hypothetical protein
MDPIAASTGRKLKDTDAPSKKTVEISEEVAQKKLKTPGVIQTCDRRYNWNAKGGNAWSSFLLGCSWKLRTKHQSTDESTAECPCSKNIETMLKNKNRPRRGGINCSRVFNPTVE